MSSWDICDFKFRIDKPVKDKIIWISNEKVYIETCEEQLKEYLKAKRK
ncbi:MAG: hypothetical protein HQK49_20395 [Oligoflexia bacterium]|nr:hypothetical protein [Oligoflexia bacterium]